MEEDSQRGCRCGSCHAAECVHGARTPAKILLDNRATFRSEQVKRICGKWSVSLRFRCAHRPSGNGIVERIHRTIKRTAATSRISPAEAMFWYNLAPLNRDPESVPSIVFFRSRYKWHNPNTEPLVATPAVAKFQRGDFVFVKPASARCTSQLPTGRVTAVLSDQAVEVNGVPRHVADCRLAVPRAPAASSRRGSASDGHGADGDEEPQSVLLEDEDSDSEDEGGSHDARADDDQPQPASERPKRNVRAPDRFIYSDSAVGFCDCRACCVRLSSTFSVVHVFFIVWFF